LCVRDDDSPFGGAAFSQHGGNIARRGHFCVPQHPTRKRAKPIDGAVKGLGKLVWKNV
jgi:hypothetical protein